MKWDNYLSETRRLDLFHKIWSEPFADIKYWYGTNNNTLAALCELNDIPMPNPVLTPENVDIASKFKPKFLQLRNIKLPEIEGITEDTATLTFRTINNINDLELKRDKSLDFLDEVSQISLREWCSSLGVAKQIKYYHPLITEHKIEYEYRMRRDAEHPFYDIEKYLNPFHNPLSNSKVEYRKNKCVLPISVSDKSRIIAYSIMESILRIITALSGQLNVSTLEDIDNCEITVLGDVFNLYLDEIYIKRRYLINESDSRNSILRPRYEKIPSGTFRLTIDEIKRSNRTGKTNASRSIILENLGTEIAKWLSDFVLFILNAAIQELIKLHLNDYKYVLEEQNKKLQERIAETKRKEEEYEEQLNKNIQHIVDNIDQRMYGFERVNKLRIFVQQLNEYISCSKDKENSDLIMKYIEFLEGQIKLHDPISDILDDAKLL